MKKTILDFIIVATFTFIFCHLSAQHEVEFLNANNVNAGIGIGGNLFSRLDSATVVHDLSDPVNKWDLYEAPKGTNKKTVFTASLWLSALDGGSNAHCAAQTYKFHGGDFFDGPIADTYSADYDNYFKHVFKIMQSQINHYRTLVFPSNSDVIDSSILLWPGKGNTFVASIYGVNIASPLAPFVDVDNDGIYNPLNGDYPAICGNEAVFFVFNDERDLHQETNSLKIGVEVRGLAYVYIDSVDSGFLYEKRAINNTVFVQYDIENKSTNTYHDFYLALWEDPDIGCYNNDRIGCDTARNLMFAYNGTLVDFSCEEQPAYFPYRAAQGAVILNHNMSDFIYFVNDPNGGQTDYFNCPALRNYETGFWSDGMPFTQGGTGYGGTQLTKFIFPGDPNDTMQWSDYSIRSQLPAGDRRMAASIEPMDFSPGEIKHFDLAFTTAYDSTATFISIVDTLKRDADIVQAFYNNNIVPCRNELISTGIHQINDDDDLNVLVFPNPSNSHITIEAGANIESLIMTDMTGRIILQQTINAKKATINVFAFAKGVYLLKLKSGNKWGIKKVVIE